MSLDKATILAREMGRCPDRFWYQLNGRSAQENYAEQVNKRNQKEGEVSFAIVIESKVNTK